MNTLGTLIFYVCQWGLSLAVVRLGSSADVGRLQLAMTVTNIFNAVSVYNMRAFQVSDLHDEYSAGHYVAARILTCAAALLLCLGYSLIWGYREVSLLCILLYMLYRLSESFADVLHGVDQKHDRMDHVLVSYVLRGILMLILFTGFLALHRPLSLTVFVMALVTWSVVLLYDLRAAGAYDSLRPRFEAASLRRLLWICLPGVLASVGFAAVVSIPRQMLGRELGEELLGYYATIATPLVFLQVLLNSLMNPALGAMARVWEQKDVPGLRRLCGSMLALILGVGALVYLGVLWLGEPVMALIYGDSVRPYVSLMPPVILCTVVYAAGCIGFNLLIVARKMKTLLVMSLAAVGLASLTASPLIQAAGADGVSWAVVCGYGLFTALSLAYAFLLARKGSSAVA